MREHAGVCLPCLLFACKWKVDEANPSLMVQMVFEILLFCCCGDTSIDTPDRLLPSCKCMLKTTLSHVGW